MPRIRVVTDSTCDIPDALLKQFDITVVPHSVRWGQESFLDRGNPITSVQLQRLEDDTQPRPEVIVPSVEDFNRVYRSMRDTCDGVLSIHASSKLSEIFLNANTAREAFGPVGHGGPFPIAVVDSASMSMGLGWLTLMLARVAGAGLELTKLATIASRQREQTHFAFITDNVQPLLESGKLHAQKAQWGTLSTLKPLVHIDEGQMAVYERTRTRAKARDALYNFVEDFATIGEMAILHTGAENDLDHLLTRIGAIYPRERIIVIQPSLTIASWLGPEVLAVAVFEGEDA